MSRPLHISLDLEAGDDPIAGTVTTEEGPRQFTGWLGLLACLQSAVASRGATVEGTRTTD